MKSWVDCYFYSGPANAFKTLNNINVVMKLKREFFARNCKTVAKELLGKILVHKVDGKTLKGKVVETEAYFGPEDPASHASTRKITKRNIVMYSQPGTAYVYFTYGIYDMLNVVTEKIGKAGAVLIRALEPLDDLRLRTNGPGLLTKAFHITRKHNSLDMCSSENFYFEDNNEKFDIVNTTRIGIIEGAEMKLRFYIKNNPFVSRK